jgi:hypothetical protein
MQKTLWKPRILLDCLIYFNNFSYLAHIECNMAFVLMICIYDIEKNCGISYLFDSTILQILGFQSDIHI